MTPLYHFAHRSPDDQRWSVLTPGPVGQALSEVHCIQNSAQSRSSGAGCQLTVQQFNRPGHFTAYSQICAPTPISHGVTTAKDKAYPATEPSATIWPIWTWRNVSIAAVLASNTHITAHWKAAIKSRTSLHSHKCGYQSWDPWATKCQQIPKPWQGGYQSCQNWHDTNFSCPDGIVIFNTVQMDRW